MAYGTRGKPRRITKIVVEEISLVTKPANGAPVLAYKAMRGMGRVREVMEEHDVDAAEMAEMADMDEDRVKKLMHGDEEPTDAEMKMLNDACDECEEEDEEDVAKNAAKKSSDGIPPELAKYVPRDPSTQEATSYAESVVMAQLSGLAKEWGADYNTAPKRDGEPDGVDASDRAREANRIDAHGIATVNSGALYPDIHVPPSKDLTTATSV